MKESRALLFIWQLTLLLFVTEVGYGVSVGSFGLISDGIHSFSNCLGIGTALLAMRWSKSSAATLSTTKATYTYGITERAEVLAAFSNSVILLLLACFLVSEVVHDALTEGSAHHGDHNDHVAFVALGGILVNGVGLMLLSPHVKRNVIHIIINGGTKLTDSSRLLNLEAVALHLSFDMVSSLGVLISTWLRHHVLYADGMVAVGIAVLIVHGTTPLFWLTLRILSQGSGCVEKDKLLRELKAEPGVLEFYQVHFWTLGPGKEVASLIVRIRFDANADAIQKAAHRIFHKAVWSLTVQVQKEKPLVVHHHHRESVAGDDEENIQVQDAAHLL